MPGHRLIQIYLLDLRKALPAGIVDELTDGLLETYDHHRSQGLDPDTAAQNTLKGFGTAEEIIAAFTHTNPDRRTARTLLATGPIVAACWATGLLTAHTWTRPIPIPPRLLFATTLLATIAILIAAARARYRTARRTSILGASSLIALDTTAIIAVAVMGLTWPLAVPVLASLTRICFTARSTARSLAGR